MWKSCSCCCVIERPQRYSLALPLQILAVETVVEAPRGVALRVALAIVEIAPALQRGRAVLPRVVEVERAVAVVPAALVVVAEHVAVLVVLGFLALRDVARHLHLRQRDVVAQPPLKARCQDVAAFAVEVPGADAAVALSRVLARASIVARVGVARAVGGVLALRSGEGRGAQARGTLAARDTGATVATNEAATRLGIVLAGGTGEALSAQSPESIFVNILINISKQRKTNYSNLNKLKIKLR